MFVIIASVDLVFGVLLVGRIGVRRRLLSAPDHVEIVHTFTAPTVIIAGDADQLINSALEELHELIPGSTLRIFEGMGHEVPEPLWDEIATLLAVNARTADRRS